MHHTLRRRAIPSLAGLVLAVLLALPNSGCAVGRLDASPDVRILAGRSPVRLDAERCDGWFLVDATINGQGPFRMLLDTGADTVVVDQTVADRMRNDLRRIQGRAVGSGGVRTPLRRALRIEELEVGALTVGGLDAAVLDLSGIAPNLSGRVDGILGWSAFEGLALTVDYPGGVVSVSRAAPEPGGAEVLPIVSRRAPIVAVPLEGRDVAFLLDTGSNGTFAVAPDVADRVGLDLQVVGVTTAINSNQPRRAARYDGAIDLAGLSFERPLVALTHGRQLIGSDVLRHYRITFDRTREGFEAAHLEPRVPTPVRMRMPRGIGLVFTQTPSGWIIRDVIARSPAWQAGLRAGDVLLAAEGLSHHDLRCGAWRELLRDEDTLDLVIERGGERLEVAVPVREPVLDGGEIRPAAS